MFIYQILEQNAPEVLDQLRKQYRLEFNDNLPFATETDIDYFDPAYEMVHDSEGRYLDYTRGHR